MISISYFVTSPKGGWGGPHPSHSAYETIFTDAGGATLDGSAGDYVINTTEPAVRAFWSITAYDTARGGFLHPNDANRYHINNTAAVRNEDGTVTFLFKTACAEQDQNCLEVPAGPFDLVARYYLPSDEIINEIWTMPRPVLQECQWARQVTDKLGRHRLRAGNYRLLRGRVFAVWSEVAGAARAGFRMTAWWAPPRSS